MFELYRLELSHQDNLRLSRWSVEEDGSILRVPFAIIIVIAEELDTFERVHEPAAVGLANETSRYLRTVFVGD